MKHNNLGEVFAAICKGSVAFAMITGLAACQGNAQNQESSNGRCLPEKAAGLVGKDPVTDEEAKRITGAAVVRQVESGQPVTMDFREDRITIEINKEKTRIVRASCG